MLPVEVAVMGASIDFSKADWLVNIDRCSPK
jgi:hypothetical protein